MKLIISNLLLILVCIQCNTTVNNISNEKIITKSINEILQLAKENKIEELNSKFIHSEIGFYEIKRIGLSNKVFHHTKIELTESALGTVYQLLSNHSTSQDKLATSYNAKFNCDSQWDKSGLFYTYRNVDSDFLNLISDKRLTERVNNTIRVVITEDDIIFYLIEINNKYYLTIFDRATIDCSA